MIGCANRPGTVAPTVPTVTIVAPFNEAEASKLLLAGTNSIKGNAFMRQRGGGVVTCAGATVRLIPATGYAKERVQALYYGGATGSYIHRGLQINFAPDVANYQNLLRTTKCDSTGNFQFEKVADGEFFITVTVNWDIANSSQGGSLMNRLTVKGGESTSLVMSE